MKKPMLNYFHVAKLEEWIKNNSTYFFHKNDIFSILSNVINNAFKIDQNL